MAKSGVKRDKFSPLTVIMLVVLVVWCIVFLFALFWALMQSLKVPTEFTYDKQSFWKFDEITFINYKYVVLFASGDWMSGGYKGSPGFLEIALNTLMYSVGGALLHVISTCLMAYLAARYQYFFSKIIYTIVIVTMVVPIIGSQASEIEILERFNLYDTRLAFIVLKAGFIGMYFLVFYAAFKTIPMTYTEAAMMDGASDWCIMVKICLPLVVNVFMTVFLITFIQYWNDYQLALVYMPSYPTLSYFVFMLQQTGRLQIPGHGVVDSRLKPTVLASTFFLILPIALIFMCFHKRLMGNLTIGGIKG